MRRNLDASHGLVFSQRVLLALVASELGRDAAYGLVQRNALQAWDEELDFRELVRNDPEIAARLDPAALDDAFDLESALAHVDVLFERLASLANRREEVLNARARPASRQRQGS